MDYNTVREKLQLPEYGRYIHNFVEIIKALPTKEERTKAAHSLVNVMGSLNSSLRDTSDFRRKLWDHIFIISDYDLDVDCPFPMPDRKMLSEKPQPVKYANSRMLKPHYGKIIEQIAQCIPNYEGEQKDELISLVANTMKKNYINWNKCTVADQTILSDLKQMCPQSLEISDEMKLYTEPREPQSNDKNRNNDKNGKPGFKKNKNRRNRIPIPIPNNKN